MDNNNDYSYSDIKGFHLGNTVKSKYIPVYDDGVLVYGQNQLGWRNSTNTEASRSNANTKPVDPTPTPKPVDPTPTPKPIDPTPTPKPGILLLRQAQSVGDYIGLE